MLKSMGLVIDKHGNWKKIVAKIKKILSQEVLLAGRFYPKSFWDSLKISIFISSGTHFLIVLLFNGIS